MAGQGNVIPVYREFLGDMETPVSSYLKIRDKSFSYLLESADGGARWGRYSFIGYRPYVIALSRGRKMEIQQGDRKETLKDVSNPLDVLRDLSRRFRLVKTEDGSPFQGGLVGYCNYDLVGKWEHIPGISSQDDQLPECLFTASKRLIIFDHLTHKIRVIAFAHLTGNQDLKEAYATACDEVDETISELKTPLSRLFGGDQFSVSDLKPNVKKEEFEEAVRKAKNYIVEGDVIQVVLSQKFS